MHKLYELKEKLMKELEEYADNGKFSRDDVETIKYASSAIDHICNIMDRSDEEYSSAMMPYTYGGSYARDGMGRYTRGGRRGGANQYGSYAGGYSRAGEDIAEQLRGIMHEAPNEHVRMEIERLANKVEKM